MRIKEKEGLTFVADDKVPISYFNELIDGMDSEEIKDVIKYTGTKWDITDDWEMYIKARREEMDDILFCESKEMIKELDKIWRELVKNYLDQEKNS